MTGHSLLPWGLERYAEKGLREGTLENWHTAGMVDARGEEITGGQGIHAFDVLFILKAVNSHYIMREALEKIATYDVANPSSLAATTLKRIK